VTLSERLAEARRQRLIEAGEVPPDPETTVDLSAASPSTQEPEAYAPRPAIEGIEYRPRLRLVRDEPTADDDAPDQACPTCHGPANVDMVDLVGQTTHLSCVRCGTLWYTSSRGRSTTSHT
jgi:hypothetical protein